MKVPCLRRLGFVGAIFLFPEDDFQIFGIRFIALCMDEILLCILPILDLLLGHLVFDLLYLFLWNGPLTILNSPPKNKKVHILAWVARVPIIGTIRDSANEPKTVVILAIQLKQVIPVTWMGQDRVLEALNAFCAF